MNYTETQVQLPNGKTSTREWIDHPGAACIAPILDDGKYVCLQYRYGPRKVYEIPAGKLDKNESRGVLGRAIRRNWS